MASYNRVILAGNLTRDPQLSYTPSNTPVCEFGLAMNRRWKDNSGTMREDVCFVDLVSYGRGGEIINQYMRKGRSILVEGRLRLRQWTNQEGQKRSKLDVVVENFTFLDSAPGGGGNRGGGGPERSRGAGGEAWDAGPSQNDSPPPEDGDVPGVDQEVPF